MTIAKQNQKHLHPQFAEVINELEEASEKARQVAGNLTAEQLKKRPEPDKWSIAECLVHLNITSQEYLILFGDTFARASKEKQSGESKFKMDLLGRFLKWTLEPPPMSVFKTKTSEKFQPINIEPVGEVLPTFLSLQEQLKANVEKANGLALDRIKVVSPFNSKIKYNLLSCFNILLAHERRHLWQAAQVKNVI